MSDSSSSSTASTGGVGILGLLGVVFVTLKLLGITEVATWSWWWVTAPFWGGFALMLLVFLILVCLAVWASH
jgi:hypothetical protein